MEKDLAIGVDIGGTNIKLGLVDEQGRMFDDLNVPLIRKDDDIADVSFIGKTIADFIRSNNVSDRLKGVGIASPGMLDAKNGIVNYAVNLGWVKLGLAPLLQEQLQLPVRLESDAVAGAIGERYYGAGVNMSSFLFVCIGTGVGASLIVDNHLYQGECGSVINIGHTSIIKDGKPCECGNRGCLEKYVSAPAITQRVRMELQTTETLLHEYLSEPRSLDSKLIYEAARNGDPYAIQVYQEAGQLLGISLVNCLHLFGVGNMIIGGGLSQAGPYLLDPARQIVAERFGEQDHLKVNIAGASFPTISGVLGAAKICFMQPLNQISKGGGA